MSPKKPTNNIPTYVISFIGNADERAAQDSRGQGPLMDFLAHLLNPDSQGLPPGPAITSTNLVLVLLVDEHPNLNAKLAVVNQVKQALKIQVELVNFGGTLTFEHEFCKLKPFDRSDHNPIVDTGYIGSALDGVQKKIRGLHSTCRIFLHPTSGTAHVRTVMTVLPLKWQDPHIYCVEWPNRSERFIVQDLGFIRDDLVRQLFPDVIEVTDHDDPKDIRNQQYARKFAAYSAEEFNDKKEKIPTPVLITGPSGTGKEILAEVIIQEFQILTGIPENDCLRLNCAALPDELAESLLFGHVKGSFTSATSDHEGAFGMKKLLFLDEIGDLSEPNQAKLLRVLESGTFIKVGENTERKSRAFVIAATNSPRKLRPDLLFRLAGFHLECPPLAIKAAEHRVGLVTKLSNIFGREAKDLFEKEAIEYLTKEPFEDGNYRELRGLIRRCVVFRDLQGQRIGLADLQAEHHKIGKLLSQKEAQLDMQQVGVFLYDQLMEKRKVKGSTSAMEDIIADLKLFVSQEHTRRYPDASQKEKAAALGVTEHTLRNWEKR